MGDQTLSLSHASHGVFLSALREDKTYKDVEAGGFEQGDLVSNGQRGEAR